MFEVIATEIISCSAFLKICYINTSLLLCPKHLHGLPNIHLIYIQFVSTSVVRWYSDRLFTFVHHGAAFTFLFKYLTISAGQGCSLAPLGYQENQRVISLLHAGYATKYNIIYFVYVSFILRGIGGVDGGSLPAKSKHEVRWKKQDWSAKGVMNLFYKNFTKVDYTKVVSCMTNTTCQEQLSLQIVGISSSHTLSFCSSVH